MDATRQLLWTPFLPAWLLAGLGLTAALAVLVLYARQRRVARGWAGWALVALRLALVGGIVALLARPVLRVVHAEHHQPTVAVLVDVSGSMGIADRLAAEDDASAPGPLTRLEQAQAALLGEGPGRPGLLDALARDHRVRVYAFAGQAGLADPARLSVPAVGAAPPVADPSALPGDALRTDLAGALEQVWADLGGEVLAGVVVLTDGRHNAPASPLEAARRLARADVPILSALVGDTRPPTDAAVMAVEAPDTVFVDDRLEIRADVKLDGLAGRSVRVTLRVDDEVRDSVELTPAGESFRTRVVLRDTPVEARLHHYRVAIDPLDGEVLLDNNAHPLAVAVTADRTDVLLIDGGPRWEYRYLKNLFASRDRTVRLQHVLLAPIAVADAPAGPVVPAAVTNPDPEANALPADEAEWLKFDVIILGDVAPDVLGPEARRVLERFVGERGGTLVVVAGAGHMPAAWASTVLADLLPVTFPAGGTGLGETFRVALTDEGRASELLRLADDVPASLAVWNRLPPLHWRAEVLQAKPSATVLAWADPDDARDDDDPADAPGRLDRQRRDVARRALVVSGDYGLGKVLWVGLDATWRLRYRVGDTHHHRFWGQVMRWATAARLPAGVPQVRLGLDRARYAPRAQPVARARLLDGSFAPLQSEQVAVRVYRDGQPVLRQPLRYLEGSAGLYEGRLPALPGGQYTLVLDAPDAQPLLDQAGLEQVQTEFTVDPSTPAEWIELAADPALPAHLAELHPRGRAVPVAQAAELADALAGVPYQTRRVREVPLAAHWSVLAALLTLATAEWIVRKRTGLP